MKIRYIGELFENSGYGVAARLNIALLHKMGHEIEVVPTGARTSTDPDWKIKLLKDLQINTFEKPDIIIAHIYPPQSLEQYKQEGIPLVSYIAWEVDMLPSTWVYHLNKHADYIITTCTEIQKVFIKSGVHKPVYQIGPTIFQEDLDKISSEKPTSKEELPEGLNKIWNPDKIYFYGVFQWIERKDPEKLIQAFLQEFDKSDESVCLILKSYRADGSQSEIQAIVKDIQRVHSELSQIYSPEIRLLPERMTEDEMGVLHNMCHIYVTPHRGEGTGLGIIDAILHRNQVITTPYGGPMDFTRPDYTRWLKYRMIPIRNKVWCKNYFNGNMKWADVDVEDLRLAMRESYNEVLFNMKNDPIISELNTQGAMSHIMDIYSEEKNKLNMGNILESIK